MNSFFRITSVTRWLLVVIGCAVLATAQPMSAATAAAEPAQPAARAPDAIIYPNNPSQTPPPKSGADSSHHSLVAVAAILLASAGAWVLFQRRQGGPLASRSEKKLLVTETRPLGNRQYLVVADYEGQRFLLGVTPGRIQMLTPLKTPVFEDKLK
jgi:flagellar protein FliO/FliZ